jgi:anthraniloyl-CoA monooxygenase
MRISVLGGGPGGLYFSILMKKANPAADITVIERNRPSDTFGWGVVFSDKTLGNFALADPGPPRSSATTTGTTSTSSSAAPSHSGGHGFGIAG